MEEPTISTDLSDVKYIMGTDDNVPHIHIFDKDRDIYDLISYFLEKKSLNTTFYIVDLNKIEERFRLWKQHLPDISPFYAVKCNPDPMIIRILSKLGCGFDCASKEEIISVQNVSEDADIIYANPCKEINQIQFARSCDVDLLTFDSECELHKIKLNHPKSDIILRIKVDDSGSLCRFNSKFGCGDEEIDKLIDICLMLNLNLVGVSFHVGSGCKELGKFRSSIQKCKNVYDKALEKGIKMSIIDIGGGFPGTDKGVKFEDIAQEINSSIDEFFKDTDVRFIAEPGRFFATTSHTLVVNIIGIKINHNKETGEKEYQYTLNEGVYGSFSCKIFDYAVPEILPYNERKEKTFKSTIFGPTCDSLDIISNDVMLPELAVGDWCFVKDFGAYTRASSTSFNGFKPGQIFYTLST